MQRWIGLSVMLLTFAVIGCSAPKPDDIVKKSIKQWEEAADILEGVTDEDSLRDAAGKLDRLAQRMIEANRQAADLEISLEEKRKVDSENRTQSQAALKRYAQAEKKVREIPGGPQVLVKFRRMAGRTF